MPALLDIFGPRPAFDGGLFLSDYKAETARRPIETLNTDGPLHIPLQVRRGLETIPVVKAGDRVLAGQRLSQATSNDSVPVHAPVAGRILRLDRAWTTHDGYLPCAVIEPDGTDDTVPQHQGWEEESVIVQLAECGAMCSRPRRPLHRVIQEAVAAGVTDLIINAMETEPYLTADLRTLVEQPGRTIDASCELADALGVSRAILAVPFRHRRVVKRLLSEASGRFLEIAALANPYPQCHPTVLLKSVLDREVAPGGNALDEGAVVLPLSAVRHAAEALLDDKPVTHTIMAVAGDDVVHPGTYRVAIGTPLRRVARRVGLSWPAAKAICGGPLTGLPLGHTDAVVTVDTTALLLFSKAENPTPVPCIHCGWCVEDCPVGIDPPSLMHLESKPACTDTQRSHLTACIDCELCTHVCPAELPLAATIKRMRTRFAAAADRTRTAPR